MSGGGCSEIRRLNVWVAVWPFGSVAMTVNVNVPVAVGVPYIWPFGYRARPGGRAPPTSVQVNGGAVSPTALKLVK